MEGTSSAECDLNGSVSSPPEPPCTTAIVTPAPRNMASSSWSTYDTVFLNAKAGMDGVDKQKVQKLVYDMSKGSKYFSNEQRKEAIEWQRIENMKARAAELTPSQLAQNEKATNVKIADLEATRDLSRLWVHVDMDAFYAAVETLVNPSLAGKPMAVGGMSMICTANYEARKFGVRAAMPGFIARKLCSDLIFIKPDFKKYTHYSELSRQVFREYDSNFIARSLDEAYLDITEICRRRNTTSAAVAEELRSKVHSATGLTCSAGVGPNRMLAKVCSDINKPNGQYIIRNDRAIVMDFVSSLPIRKITGIGKVTEKTLREVLGVSTCADLLRMRASISALYSQISTDFFLAVGLGIGGSEAPQEEHRKSLGHERTFKAITENSVLLEKLDELSELLARDMLKEELQGRTVALKLKTTNFEVRTRAVTLPFFINMKSQIMEHASKLLKAEFPLSLRLMGLRISHFKDDKPEPGSPLQRTIARFISQSPTSQSLRNAAHGINIAELSDDQDNPLKVFEKEHPTGHGRADEFRDSQERKLCEDDHEGLIWSGSGETSQHISMERRKIKNVRIEQQMPPNSVGSKSPTNVGTHMTSDSCEAQKARADVGYTTMTEKDQGDGDGDGDSSGTNGCHLSHRLVNTGDSVFLQAEDYRSESLANSLGLKDCDNVSFQNQIWSGTDKCTLCGTMVNDCVPSARQEHEDYHFALFLQQQAESYPLRPETTNLDSIRSDGSPYQRTGLRGKARFQKRITDIPLEYFFKRAKHLANDEDR